MGRPAVREALFALQRMGLVEVRSGMRARVTQPTPDRLIGELSEAVKLFLVTDGGIQQFQDARASFEIGLARHAALHATPEDLHQLKEHGFLGLDESVKNGYEQVRVTFKVKGDMSEEMKEELVQIAQFRSPVFDIFTNKVPVSVQLEKESSVASSIAE